MCECSLELTNDIRELYEDYNTRAKPLEIWVEAKTEKLPAIILNEVRAMHDHVARVYLPELTDEQKRAEIRGAKQHCWRIMLDSYKVLALYVRMGTEDFFRQYKGVGLGEVDSGRFLPRLSDLIAEAESSMRRAKESESRGVNGKEDALDAYGQALDAYIAVEDFIASQAANLTWSKDRQKRWLWRGIGVNTIVSFLTGLLSGWILTMLF